MAVRKGKKKNWRPFEEARRFAQGLKLSGRQKWRYWLKTGEKPDDIPSDPSTAYSNDGWIGWGDWLGTGNETPSSIVNWADKVGFTHETYTLGSWRPFEDARAFVRKQGLKTSEEWAQWAQTDEKPADIPASPARAYATQGWIGIADWLGITNVWNRNAILSFLKGIQAVLKDLTPVELYAIMRQNNMLAATKGTGNSNRDLIRSIKDLMHSDDPEKQIEDLANQLENQGNLDDLEPPENEWEEATDLSLSPLGSAPGDEETTDQLPALQILQALKAVDLLVASGITPDEETIEFLVCNRVAQLWQDCLNQVAGFDLEQLRQETGGIYFNTIRDRFLTQYEGASSLVIPEGYSFHPPNLMQRLTAYRVLTERRLGNWSGVGAGKTVSAILSSRVIQSKSP